VVTAKARATANGRVVAAAPPSTLPRSGGPVTRRPDELTDRHGYRVAVPP
jgi:hypothetical protein